MTLLQVFFFGLGIISTVCFVVLLVLFRRREAEALTRQQRSEADMADVLALFQTMRDILSQQKNLAKEFNAEIDKKMTAVKQVLSQGIERNERLYETQQQLQQQLEDIRAEIESLQRQSGFMREGAGREIKHDPRPKQPRRDFEPKAPGEQLGSAAAFKELADSLSAPPLDAVPFEQTPGDPWETESFRADVAPPEAPRNPGAARAAFRALLDLGPDENEGPTTAPAQGNGPSAAVTPIQKRVLEYHHAGMSVAEIARELGVGKGEIRLMLSLAKQK